MTDTPRELDDVQPELLWKPTRVCVALSCSRATLWRLCARGLLKSCDLADGASLPRFRRSDVLAFIEARFAHRENGK